MTFENGYEISNYLNDDLRLSFENDNTIFKKAIDLLLIGSQRKDWPFCIDEVTQGIYELTKINVNTLVRYGYFLDDQYQGRLNWGKFTEEFKQEWRFFSKAIGAFYDKAFHGERLYPNAINSISYSRTVNLGGDRGYSLILSKNSGERFDFEIDSTIVEEIIKTLEEVKQDAEWPIR